MNAKLGLVTLSLLVCGVAACGDDVPRSSTRATCEQVRTHVVDLQLQEARARATTPSARAALERHRARSSEVLDALVDTCVETYSAAHTECLLSARSLEQAASCDRSAPSRRKS